MPFAPVSGSDKVSHPMEQTSAKKTSLPHARRARHRLSCALLASFLPLPALAQDQIPEVRVSGGLAYGYSSGDYGTARVTDIQLALATLAVEIANFKFSVSLPYLSIDGRGLVVFDAAGNPVVINRNPAIAPDVRTGWGDLYLGATYTIPPAILDGFEVRLTGRFKVPTAPERRRLGTGQEDYGFSVDVSKQFDIWGPFITVGYLMPGQPTGYVLNNMTSVSTGTSIELDDNLVAILAYDYTSASSPRVDTSQDMMASLSWIVNDNITLTGYGTKGLSRGSADVGAGLILSYGL